MNIADVMKWSVDEARERVAQTHGASEVAPPQADQAKLDAAEKKRVEQLRVLIHEAAELGLIEETYQPNGRGLPYAIERAIKKENRKRRRRDESDKGEADLPEDTPSRDPLELLTAMSALLRRPVNKSGKELKVTGDMVIYTIRTDESEYCFMFPLTAFER